MESRWDRTFFTTFGMGDRRPKACGPCVALASEQCQANPNRHTVYTFVPEEYRVEHSLNASAAVCRSHLCHAKVRLRAEPNPPGRPVGWQKRVREAADCEIRARSTTAGYCQRDLPDQSLKVRYACSSLPVPMSVRHPPLTVCCQPPVAGLIELTARGTPTTRLSGMQTRTASQRSSPVLLSTKSMGAF